MICRDDSLADESDDEDDEDESLWRILSRSLS